MGFAAALALAGCSDRSADSGSSGSSGTEGGGASTELSIQPLLQVDTEGNEVPQASTEDAATPAGDGNATCAPTTTIAMAGALTGPNAALGINIVNGVKLALDQHNNANPNCQVQLGEFDTEGDPQKATQVIPQIISNPDVIGLVGPAFSGETRATGGILSDAGLADAHRVGHQRAADPAGLAELLPRPRQRRRAGPRRRPLHDRHRRLREDLRRFATTPTTASAWRTA